MPTPGWRRPAEYLTRFALVALVVLGAAQHFERSIIESLLPLIRASITLIDADFDLLGVEIRENGPHTTMTVRADLARAVVVGGKVLRPMSWDSRTAGWMQVNLVLGGMLQYTLLVLIAVIAWPAATIREFVARLLFSLPLMGLLLFLQVPFTVHAELWAPIRNDYDSNSFSLLVAWSRFLMGGGGLAMAIVFSVVAIVGGRALFPLCVRSRSHSACNTSSARLATAVWLWACNTQTRCSWRQCWR